MNEYEMLSCYLGISYDDYKNLLETKPEMKPLLELCIRQTKRVLELEKINYNLMRS